MEIRELWQKTTAIGREALVCIAAGFAACFFAFLLGADQGIAMFFGLIVFGGLGAVALWVWAQVNKENGWAIGVDLGTMVMTISGAAALLGMLFFSDWLMRYGLWGLLAGLAITIFSAVSRYPEK